MTSLDPQPGPDHPTDLYVLHLRRWAPPASRPRRSRTTRTPRPSSRQASRSAACLALSTRYRLPAVIAAIAADAARPAVQVRQRMSLRDEVHVTTFRTPDTMLSSAQDWRPGMGGDQQHVWQATLGQEAVCFTTLPGPRSGRARRLRRPLGRVRHALRERALPLARAPDRPCRRGAAARLAERTAR